MLVCSASVLLKYWLTFSYIISSNFPCTIGPMINQLKHDCQSRSCMLFISALLLFIPKVLKNLSQGIFMKLYVAKHIKGGKFTPFQRKINKLTSKYQRSLLKKYSQRFISLIGANFFHLEIYVNMIGEIFQDSRFLDNVGKRYVENISLGIWR